MDFLYYDYDERGSVLTLNEQGRIRQIIFDIYNDSSNLLLISSTQFEEVVAELLRAQKFYIKLVSKIRKKSYDILAVQTISGFPVKFVVECKRYRERPVGLHYLRNLSDVVSTELANKGIMVTTSWVYKRLLGAAAKRLIST